MSDERQKTVKEIAGGIVSSYLSNNQLSADQVPDFIRSVVAALGGELAVAQTTAAADVQRPAVPIRRSVREDAVVCLECGAEQKTLKRHIGTAHGLTENENRAKWKLPKDHPLVAPAYSRARASMAKKIGLGRKRVGG